MKVIFNACYGGFSLSTAAIERYEELAKQSLDWHGRELERDDPILVQVVEELGELANGDFAELRIYNVTSGTKWRISEYDGNECVVTPDDYEWKVAR